MNKSFKIITILFLITCLFFLISCNNSYTVTFKNDDGTIYNEITVPYGECIKAPFEPTKEGYIFLGWYLNDEKIDFSSYVVKQNITLNAKYIEESLANTTYTITYELNGGYAQNPETYTALDKIILNNPIKEGYTFLGWTTPNNDIPYLDKTIENETEDKKFIANWSNLKFNLKENNEYEVVGLTNYSDIEIFIPKYYNGKNITSIGKDVFRYKKDLAAFYTDNDNLYFTSIDGNLYTKDEKILIQYAIGKQDSKFVVPNNVTTIAPYAFKGCESLTNITISNNLTTIGAYAFCLCSNLTTIDFLDSLTTIEDYAFYNCINLTNIVLPNNLISIGSNAFYNCENLKEITLPKNLTTIKDEAFYNTNLKNVLIPNNVTTLGASIFGNCTDIIIYCETNEIPNTWRYNWNKDDFPVHLGVTNKTLIKENNFEYILDLENKTATLARYIGTNESLEILQTIKHNNIDYTITKIGRWAFKKNENLININLPDDIELIDSSAFSNCINLKNIKLPKNLKTLAFGVFNKCMSLTSIVLPENLTTIGGSAFENCQNLTYINLPKNLTHIREYAFYNCVNLISIIIPNSVTIIERKVFNYCDNLVIYCEASSKPSGWDSAWNYTNCPVIYGISESYFVEIDNLQYILDLENNTTTVSKYLSPIQSVKIPQTITYNNVEYKVTKIDAKALFNYDSLTSIEIPNTITNIGFLAFANCTNLENVYYNGTIGDWCNITFNNNLSNPMFFAQHFYMKNNSNEWEEIKELVIPNTITNINNYQFYGFDNLISIELPNTIINIGKCAFMGCYNLTNIEFPNSVTTIGDSAFSDCDSFTNIKIPSSVTTIERLAFYSCSSLTKITIPLSVTSMKDSVFVFCDELTIYCEAISRLDGWSYDWNSHNYPVIWGYTTEE